jgi:chemotaxis protein histidine kinase CheA
MFKNQDMFSGASILGSGQLALVIDTNKMIQKYL